ncbi:hypothetical protein CYMTET_54467 [Cymbomonas tetramitiformis]|uniref:Dynein heavy chain n=1 Tax=Cymbomonas tetramitiformis TaxID=36881 RepID=A0AAE0BGM1_9CHLO|nr:hypothetical protein CYMTET_54467 [Cymbomonas tetramitiformis]
MPSPWDMRLNTFQSLLVLRALRPDKLCPGIQSYVISVLGERFVEPQPFNLPRIYLESTCASPLIFVLSPGSDPLSDLLRFADDRRQRVESVSLGQGQGPVARKLLDQGLMDGFWVVLMNCHLAKSFLPTLEVICENQLPMEATNKEFRLWLTSYPSSIFPISILENGVKITNEAPKGLRAGLLRTYESDPINDRTFFNSCNKAKVWRKLLFGLAFFHCSVRERRTYGPIGWNIPYEFNENDLRISVRQLCMFINENGEVPFDTLAYTCGECNYGGKVTDPQDRRTLSTIMNSFYHPEALKDKCPLSPSGRYYIPEHGEYQDYIDYIKTLPLISPPEVFGLHDNANISKELQETHQLLDSLMLTQSRDAGGGGGTGATTDEVIATTSADILSRLPPNFDIEKASNQYPVSYLESMNTVLVQELGRLNALLTVIRVSLVDVRKAVKGLVVMSADLEKIGTALIVGKVAAKWLAKSFPSLKPLGSYIKELLERVQFFNGWLNSGPPVVFWLCGFFFTQAFMTGAKQNFARRHKIAIDLIDFDFEMKDSTQDCQVAPDDGVYVEGMFLEGCRWCYASHHLAESDPKRATTPPPRMDAPSCAELSLSSSSYSAVGAASPASPRGVYSVSAQCVCMLCHVACTVSGRNLSACSRIGAAVVNATTRGSAGEVLFVPMPKIWMVPKKVADFEQFEHYSCPMYKTTARRGILSTTGHSTNFVMDVRLPSDRPQSHWVKRGVAMITSLND